MLLVRGVFLFGVWRKHLLISLLRLEYIVLGVYLILHYSFLNYRLSIGIGYLTFTACEGALGLTILIMMSRTHGGDYFKSFHLY